MSNPSATPHSASPDGVLGRLTLRALAYAVAAAVAAAVVAASLPAILTPLPVARLMPPPPPVVARTPVSTEAPP